MDMGGDHASTLQHLAVELRRLRDLAGISGRDLAHRIGISQSKVSRIESGSATPSMPVVTAWADAVAASADVKDMLVALTEAAFTEVHSWRTTLAERGHIQDDIQELENRAQETCTFQPALIPGLLQTAEYARRVFTLFRPPRAEHDIPAAVAGRLDRQVALFEDARKFNFLITEAALRWRPGPPRLLLAQLDRVASLMTLENVSIGLIRQDVEALAPTTHGFVIFTVLGDDADEGKQDATVMVETIHANLTVRNPDDVSLYRTCWSRLEQMAIFGDEAQRLLAEITADIRAADK